VKTFTIPMHDVYRAITDGEDAGFVKIHVREGTDRILGATIVARHAGLFGAGQCRNLCIVKLSHFRGSLQSRASAVGLA
jgi:hypothetical protein